MASGAPAPDLTAWTAALDELADLAPGATAHAGRGPALPVSDAVAAQKSWLDAADRIVADYVAEHDADELSGERAGEHHAAIADRLAAEFPAYAHPYLVTYGVYGLIHKRLQ